ncbi:phage terminase large subunit [Paraburkholderia atlantica]|uniref:phage terminase large subunit n=1 Tax=Paraburkholderia atlantica TaxID=2654982 RepID=UPI001620532D|nr:phage terminase large subunit [Paraburkholderia atlantica]MBB5508146.1 putative phage terminase large subunit-like protein [Paraburkholderia atlantica]
MEFTDKERRSFRSLSMADLYWFTRWMFVNRRGYTWQQANHHKTVCDALMRVFRGECKRLIINIPPRYSKTEIVKNFVGWSLGQAPDSEFIYTSYSTRLAAASSWDVRSLVQEAEYKAIFPAVALREDSQAKDEWRTTAGGIMYAVGAGGTITGYGAGKHRAGFGGALLIDDPHKADEARSDVMRQNVIDWFQNTFESRKNSPDTPIILIMQRLHESDLAGWLLAGGNGEQWGHVCLPALQDDGSALWPEKHSVEELRRMEAASPYTFAGQYQQRPAPAEGGIFKPDQIPIIDAIPAESIKWFRGWDLASTTDGDWTAGGKLGKLPDGRFIIGDMVRLRAGPDARDAAIVNTASSDSRAVKISIPQDPGQAGKTQVLYLTRQLAGYRVHSSPESGDKITRAEPFAAQVNVGNVAMLRGSWNAALIDEMRMFPNGAADDQIDALSRAFSQLIVNHSATVTSLNA